MKQSSPDIDKLAGIEYYTTEFDGIGGTIKKNTEDFHVQEIISKIFIDQVSPDQTTSNIFPVYEIRKKGMDSSHAILTLRKKTGLDLKIVGIKDAKATTIQYASSRTRRAIKNIDLGKIKLTLVGFSRKPIEKNNLVGNTFEIRIAEPKMDKLDNILQFLGDINSLGNYYGLQRFGSERLVTHLVGRAILERKFDKATEILLTYTTKYDSKFSREIREKLRDIKSNPNLIREIPPGMDIEKNLAQAIVRGKDSITALRTIPISIRRLFVQAFQAFLFNKTLSIAIKNNFSLTIPEENDLCFDVFEDDLIFGKIRKYEKEKPTDSRVQRLPIIRLPGYSFQPGKNRFDKIIKEFMKQENLSSKDFFIKEMQELSESGGFRQACYVCKNFKYKREENSLLVGFSVPKGSYATVLLRELIKPVNPIESGF
ncbi:tRNA pseudouridine(13) synthase TruD [Candidatus Nitrosocosmicus arcticus]|uniref:Putative tRNA pseudouridine synthase D n=1 Tax=Candidatus Nitrosocosmicus arcticus TaxID=2035267 RepID=A0A557SY32_9ARCH|nr:tRNA pseudouridine(13) synthase TruD [Candidatus Nitrosocosmicus arcticus]TVP41516.1 putative tRNA pseudouridine synthase D [Candidatus Nitrosocosmicus arcticus]